MSQACALTLFGGCVNPTDPADLSFACADIAPCAEEYFCSPVLGACVHLADEVPCNINSDCPDGTAEWTCDLSTDLCVQIAKD